VNKLFIWIADSLGTNACILLFCLIAFVPLAYQMPQTMLEWQNFISQTVIQLVALAILAKTGKIEGEKQQKLLQETHDAVMAEFCELKQLHSEVAHGRDEN